MKPSRGGLLLLDRMLVLGMLDATRTLNVLDDLAIACGGRRAVGLRHCEKGRNMKCSIVEGEGQGIATTRQRMRLGLGGEGGIERRGEEEEVATVAQTASRKE